MTPRPGESSPERARPRSAAGELAWAASAAAADEVVARMAVLRRRRRQRQLATGVGVVGVLAVAFALFRPAPPAAEPPPVVASRSVEVTAPRELRLSDGSVVILDGQAQISVALSAGLRRVTLSAGEAHFDVAKDPARPFVVAAGGVEVRAVGTAFAVRHEPAAVDVLVTEGKVAVSRAAGAPAFVDAGHGVLVPLAPDPADAPPVVRPVSKPEQAGRLAWRLPHLRFSATPLAEAVAVFNRHAPLSGSPQLSIDPALAGLQISGTLRADDLDSLLVLLRNDFGLTAGPAVAGTVHLRRP